MKRIIVLLIIIANGALGFAQNKFSTQDLHSDAKLLWSALNELHPGLYRHTDTASMKSAYKKLVSDFSSDRNSEETFLLLSQFTAKVKCGHTYLNPFNQSNGIITSVLKEKVLLPFTFAIIDKKMIVEKTLSEELSVKNVITHINGIEVASIFDTLTNYIKADGNRYNKKVKDLEVHLTSKYEYFDYYFSMVFGFKDKVELTLNGGNSKTIQLLTKEERKISFSKLFPTLNASFYDEMWKKKFHENHAYLQLGTFVTWRLTFDWEEYLDDFFTELEAKGIQNLIIDIRGNEGGLTGATEYLIKKLSKREGETVFRKPHLAYKKVSENLKPHVSTWSKYFYNTTLWTKKLDEDYRTVKFSANKSKRIKKNKKAYTGQTYLLVDETNSSATFILAEVCKKNNYATLVGTETGGTKKGITAGQMFFLTLPKTKIEVDIPLIGRYPLVDLPDVGIQPDILVEQSIIGYINNRDEPLEKAMELIDKVKQ